MRRSRKLTLASSNTTTSMATMLGVHKGLKQYLQFLLHLLPAIETQVNEHDDVLLQLLFGSAREPSRCAAPRKISPSRANNLYHTNNRCSDLLFVSRRQAKSSAGRKPQASHNTLGVHTQFPFLATHPSRLERLGVAQVPLCRMTMLRGQETEPNAKMSY